MRSTALTTSLLLAAAAALASGAVLTPGSGRVVGLGPTCRNIGAQEAAIARALGTTATLRSLSNSETAVAPRDLSLSPRDPSGQYNLCGILRGDQRSAAFTLDASHRWNAYWVDDRPIIGGTVIRSCLPAPAPSFEPAKGTLGLSAHADCRFFPFSRCCSALGAGCQRRPPVGFGAHD